MKQPSELPTKKKPYQPPKLLAYGDLTHMTQSVGIKGNPDGGHAITRRRTGR
jgi:hypothetical protein